MVAPSINNTINQKYKNILKPLLSKILKVLIFYFRQYSVEHL